MTQTRASCAWDRKVWARIPACYDLGGTEPTLTDTLLTLRWLPADYFLGGSRKLNVERAREVIEQHIAKPLGKSVEQAVLDIASAAFQMVANTMRDVLGRVDWRPEESTLFTFGGNGPAFACGVAERVSISQVYIFDLGAVFSAFGSSISVIAHVYEHGLNISPTGAEGQRRVREVIERMRTKALHDMKGEGFTPDRVRLSLEAEVTDTDSRLNSVVEDLSSTAPVDPRFLQTRQGSVELLRQRSNAALRSPPAHPRWTFADRGRQGASRCDLGACFRPGNSLHLGSAASRA